MAGLMDDQYSIHIPFSDITLQRSKIYKKILKKSLKLNKQIEKSNKQGLSHKIPAPHPMPQNPILTSICVGSLPPAISPLTPPPVLSK